MSTLRILCFCVFLLSALEGFECRMRSEDERYLWTVHAHMQVIFFKLSIYSRGMTLFTNQFWIFFTSQRFGRMPRLPWSEQGQRFEEPNKPVQVQPSEAKSFSDLVKDVLKELISKPEVLCWIFCLCMPDEVLCCLIVWTSNVLNWLSYASLHFAAIWQQPFVHWPSLLDNEVLQTTWRIEAVKQGYWRNDKKKTLK